MNVKLNKTADDKWSVVADGEAVGICKWSNAYHGSYEVKLNNGVTINAFSQKKVKEMVADELIK